MKTGRVKFIAIVLLVVALHAAVFLFIADRKPLPHRRHIPPDNFFVAEESAIDSETGERIIHREFTVRTRLASPGEVARAEAKVEAAANRSGQP